MIIFRHFFFKLRCNISPPGKFFAVFYVSNLCSEHFHARTTHTHTHNTRRRSDVNPCAKIPEISFHDAHERNAEQAYIGARVLVAEYYKKPSELSGRKGKSLSVKQSAHILTIEEFSVRLWICTRFHALYIKFVAESHVRFPRNFHIYKLIFLP
jgi:hypothetical protein